MKTKCIHLSDEDYNLLNQIKETNHLKSDGKTVSFLLKQYLVKSDLPVQVRKELERHYLDKDRVKWGVQTAEKNSVIILDALNSILFKLNADTSYCVDDIIHPIIDESRNKLNNKIAHFKQNSDDKKSRTELNNGY